jgi:hypothetical protein
VLPNTIVGTVVTAAGPLPFVIDTATGQVKTGNYAAADPDQRNMGSMENGAVDKQVRANVGGAKDVRIGSYHCAKCSRWIDVIKRPGDWSGDSCSRC